MRERIIQKAKALHEKKINEAISKSNRIREQLMVLDDVNDAYTKYMATVSSCIQKGTDPYRASQPLYQKYLDALKKHGYDDSFGYKPFCPKCEDTGIVNGKSCDCFYNEYLQALKEECEIDTKALVSFDDAKFEIIDNKNQRENLIRVYDLMQKYIEKHPNVTKYNILLSGGVGTGKTSLASSIARAAVEKGDTVKILSAYEFNTLMISCHTSPVATRSELLSDVLTADYLIIDDLGTEPITKNVTVEYLLLVLNERTISKKATIITTNLSMDGISSRYGERIYSRLSDKNNSLIFHIDGKDLRRK